MLPADLHRKVIVVLIALAVGLFHFLTRPGYRGPLPLFVNYYLMHILVPFAMFLVLGVADQRIVRSRVFRGVAVFAVGVVAETLQYFGVPVFGRTFDWLGILMFAMGIGLAAIFERFVLDRVPTRVASQPPDGTA
jgi:hypothetical protein